MTWQVWVLFAMTETFLCLSPGPAVLFVISHGLMQGGAASLWANAGILAGNAFYFLLSLFGVALLLGTNELFPFLQLGCAGYLVFLGIRTMRGSGLAVRATNSADSTSGWKMLVRGFVLQIANPKALMFFVALLPQFLDLRRPIAVQIGILALTSVLIEFVVLGTYGYLAGGASVFARRPSFVKWMNLASGMMLIVAAMIPLMGFLH